MSTDFDRITFKIRLFWHWCKNAEFMMNIKIGNNNSNLYLLIKYTFEHWSILYPRHFVIIEKWFISTLMLYE